MPNDRPIRDVAPPADWQPKSDFFKAIFAKAETSRRSKKLSMTCPCCGELMILNLTID